MGNTNPQFDQNGNPLPSQLVTTTTTGGQQLAYQANPNGAGWILKQYYDVSDCCKAEIVLNGSKKYCSECNKEHIDKPNDYREFAGINKINTIGIDPGSTWITSYGDGTA